MLAFMVPSMNCSSQQSIIIINSASSTHAAPDHDTPSTMLDCRQETLVFVLLTCLPPHTLDTTWTKSLYLGLIRPQDMVPVIHVLSLLVFSKLFSSVSGSWQSSYSLRHLYVEQQFFFQIVIEFFAMMCHVELPVTSMREWERYI